MRMQSGLLAGATLLLLGGTASAAATSITFAVPDDPAQVSSFKDRIAAYEQAHPDVHIELLPFSDAEFDEKVEALFAAGTPPDLFVSGDVMIPYLVGKKMALDLAPLVAADGTDLSDFFQPTVDFFRINGGLYALTDNWDAQVIYVNRTMFEQAGLSLPDMNTTWDGLLASAKKLSPGGTNPKQYGMSFSPWFAPVFSFMWQNGGGLFADDLSHSTIDDPGTVGALQWVADLFNQSHVSLFWDDFDRMNTDPIAYFADGHAGMLFDGGRWHVHEFETTLHGFDWVVAPLPRAKTHASFFHLGAYLIASQSAHPKEAWGFLKYLVGPEGQRLNDKYAEGIPSRRSVALDPAFSSTPLVREHNSVQPFIDTSPYLHKVAMITTWPQVLDAFDQATMPLWQGKKSASQVALGLKSQFDRLLAEGRLTAK